MIKEKDFYVEYPYHPPALEAFKKLKSNIPPVNSENDQLISGKQSITQFFTDKFPPSEQDLEEELQKYAQLIKQEDQNYYTAIPWQKNNHVNHPQLSENKDQ